MDPISLSIKARILGVLLMPFCVVALVGGIGRLCNLGGSLLVGAWRRKVPNPFGDTVATAVTVRSKSSDTNGAALKVGLGIRHPSK